MSLPEVNDEEHSPLCRVMKNLNPDKWENSECKYCPVGDKNLWDIARRPCTEKKRIVLKGNFCAVAGISDSSKLSEEKP